MRMKRRSEVPNLSTRDADGSRGGRAGMPGILAPAHHHTACGADLARGSRGVRPRARWATILQGPTSCHA